MSVEEALTALKTGKIVLIYDEDDRESETDMVVASSLITPKHIAEMRTFGGGLICTCLTSQTCDLLGLPFLTDIFSQAYEKYPILSSLVPNDIPYDERSSFSITINHRKTFTGITDNDRALTISKLAHLVEKEEYSSFGTHFRSPGHVHLLRGAENLVFSRQGHTEISLALAKLAGILPMTTICEMMCNDGNALSKEKANEYAKKKDLVFISGEEIINAYKNSK